MQQQVLNTHPILERARIAVALNRTPGYHFCGNFFNLLYDEVDKQHSVVHMDAAAQCVDQDGQLSMTAFAMLADMGLATGIRFGLDKTTRLATVSISLQLTGAPRLGRALASSKSQGFIQEAVPEVLRLVGLEGKADRLPNELSGGEQQRVALARAIVNKPALLLADEPTGNLDPATSQDIMALIERINLAGTTVIMATHDRGIVDRLKKRVIELKDGEIIRDQIGGSY